MESWEWRIMGLEYLLLASLEPGGLEIIAGYPKSFSDEMGVVPLRSFPFSAKGGEIVKFVHGGFYFVGITLRLEGEKPRAGIASLLAVSRNQGDIARLEGGLVKVYRQLTENKALTKELLKSILPDIFRTLESYEASGEEKRYDRGIVDKALERSRGLFFM